MRHSLITVCCAILFPFIASSQSWPAVTADMKPGTRWWWLGSAVDSANISTLLGEYARSGIGAVEITPIYGVQGNEKHDIPFLSSSWMKMLQITEECAASSGILVDMNQGTGWPFGGPEVALHEAACKITFLVDTVDKGQNFSKELNEKERGLANLLKESRRPIPDGREEIIRAYMSRTLQRVKRAAPGGEGLVIDHFNKDAVKHYLAKFDTAFKKHPTPSWPHSFFNDSYEVYGANWTPSLPDEFIKRHGYDLLDHLPCLLGLVDDRNKVLADYRETLGELLLENFTEQWVDWAHERGVMVRNQAHGSPANLIDLYAAVDIPEIEGFGLSDFGIKGLRDDKPFTRRNDSDVSMLKYASSAAHITGKPLTSSETFTWLTEHFRSSLSQMKPDLDLMFTCGVNNVYFHGTTFSPVDAEWPGWKFYASVDMSPTNTIWRDSPAMLDYISRAQSMLRQGYPDNDFLVYLPYRDMLERRIIKGEKGLLMAFSIHNMNKLAPDFINSVMQIDSLGYDCDYISDKYLLTTQYDGSRLVTDAQTSYKALIIPGSGNLSPRLQSHLDSLSNLGAAIIYGIDTIAIKKIARPEELRTAFNLRTLRRKTDDGYIYFIANLTPHDIDAPTRLATKFTDAAWFDPMTGGIYRADTDGNAVHVNLKSGQSRILRTYNHSIHDLAAPKPTAAGQEYDMSDNPWTLSFIESFPVIDNSYRLDSLTYWTELNDSILDQLAGTGVYTTHLDIPGTDSVDGYWQLILDDLRESARIYVNYEYVGTVWAAPFMIDFTGKLRHGDNTLRIEVTNLPANRISTLDRRGHQWRKFKEINMVDINYKKTDYSHWTTVPSGLKKAVLRKLTK